MKPSPIKIVANLDQRDGVTFVLDVVQNHYLGDDKNRSSQIYIGIPRDDSDPDLLYNFFMPRCELVAALLTQFSAEEIRELGVEVYCN